MLGSFNNFTVKGGKIRVRCPHCQKVRYHAVPLNLRRKIARCHCGKSTHCMLNYRMTHRESNVAKAEVVLDTRTFHAQISDTSAAGIGFTVKGLTKAFKVGQDVIIRFKTLRGKINTRKIRIMNVSPSRIGAQYTDIQVF